MYLYRTGWCYGRNTVAPKCLPAPQLAARVRRLTAFFGTRQADDQQQKDQGAHSMGAISVYRPHIMHNRQDARQIHQPVQALFLPNFFIRD
jgi:dienelactone hydrolase